MTDDRGYPPAGDRNDDDMPSLVERVSPEPAATRPEWGEQPTPTGSAYATPSAPEAEGGVELYTRQTASETPAREDEFGVRIDELVSSALEDQAREHREVTETLSASRDALVATHREVARLRELLEAREQGIEQIRDRIQPLERAILDLANLISEIPVPLRSAIEDSVTAIGSEMGRNLDSFSRSLTDPIRDLQLGIDSLSSQQTSAVAALAEELGAAISETARLGVADITEAVQNTGDRTFERVSSGLDGVSDKITQVSDALETTSAGLSDALTEATAEITDALQEQGGEVGEVVGRAVTTLSKRLDDLTQRVHETDLRLAESNTRVEALQESLIAYLSQRDERLERVRDTILENLIEEMASSLRTRDRARLAAALRDAEQRRKDHRDAERYRKLRGTSPGPREDEITATRSSLQAAGRTGTGGAATQRPVAEPGVRKQPPPAARPAGTPGATGGRGEPPEMSATPAAQGNGEATTPGAARSRAREEEPVPAEPARSRAQRPAPRAKQSTPAKPAAGRKVSAKPKAGKPSSKPKTKGTQSKAKARSAPATKGTTRTQARVSSRPNAEARRGARPQIESQEQPPAPTPQRAAGRSRPDIRIEGQE